MSSAATRFDFMDWTLIDDTSSPPFSPQSGEKGAVPFPLACLRRAGYPPGGG